MTTFCTPLPWQGLTVSGPDAEKFLQGQLTCDVAKITATQSSLGAYCNLKGRIVSLFRLYRHADQFTLVMPSDIIHNTYQILQRYVLFSKVMLNIATDIQVFGLMGVDADLMLPNLQLPTPNGINSTSHRGETTVIAIAVGISRFLIISRDKKTIEALQQITTATNAQTWLAADIEAKLPYLSTNTVGSFLPQEIGLDQLGGISFNKGCYLGQEIIARLHYRGQLKKQLRQVEFNAVQAPIFGSHISTEQGDGQLICAAQKSPQQWLGLMLMAQ